LFPCEIKKNGITTFWIEIPGKSADASMPERGTNAIDKISKVLATFERFKEKLTKRTYPLTGRPSFVSCIINGGWWEVIVADSCRLQITTHLVPGETAQQRNSEMIGILEGIKQEDPAFNYSIIFWKNDLLGMPLPSTCPNRPKLDPTEISREEPIVQAMFRASEDVFGKPLTLGGTRYACDSPDFVNDEHILALVFGPGNIEQAHTYNEWIDIEELIKTTMMYAVGAVEYLGHAE
jgi:acetylornithine deacetylase/succinyl-diaminopimelate desuccinylase-like protein